MPRLFLLAMLLPTSALALAPRTPLPQGPVDYDPSVHRGLLVKVVDGLDARVSDRGTLVTRRPAPTLQAALSGPGLTVRPWLPVSEAAIQGLRERAARLSGREQPDLGAFLVVEGPPEALDQAVEVLLSLEAVEHVDVLEGPVAPPGDLDPVTPAFDARQGYLDSDPGINARTAWLWGVTGAGVRVSDCEYGWHPAHEDLVDGDLQPEADYTVEPEVAARNWDDHGTAVLGEIVGQHNAYGVSGIAPDVQMGLYSEWTVEGGYDRGRAIFQAIDDSRAGDVVLLEMQAGGPDGRLAPAEINSGVWTLVRTGVDAGVIVVGAAGNGAADLDSSAYAEYRNRGSSGAILVGAGTSTTAHSRLGFSTYGARVDLQGWGQNVFTTGYGGFARYGGSDLQTYTATFSGTSSASPIVTGAVALLVEAIGQYRWDPPSPVEVRDLLVASGTPAAAGSGIGPLPDMAAALARVESTYDVLPQIVEVSVPEGIVEGQTFTLTADTQVLETLSGRVSWTVNGEDAGEGLSVTWPAPQDGDYAVQAVLTDTWGRTDAWTGTVSVLNAPPILLDLVVTGEPIEGSRLRLTASGSDPGDDPVTYVWTVDGAPSDTDNAELELPVVDDGPVQVAVVAVDDAGATSEPRSVPIDVANAPPTVTVLGMADVRRKDVLVLRADVQDPGEQDTHTITWDLGDGTTATGVDVEHAWTDNGPVSVTVTVVDDDGGTVVATETVTVVKRGCGCSAAPTPIGALPAALLALLVLGRRRRRQACSGLG